MTEKIKVLIIGSGPAGYTAAIYAARADLKPVLIEGLQPGGQLTITTEVENFPGYPEGVSGTQLMDDLKRQAERFGTLIKSGMVTKADLSERPFNITMDDNNKLLAETVIIATGASARWLGLPSEAEYNGYGVSACALCDGFFYKNKVVAVAGGGDTACEEATYLAKICSKVYLIHRRDELRASKAMQNKVFNTPNLKPVWNSVIKEIKGESKGFSKAVNSIIVADVNSGAEKQIPLDGVFIAIGHKPNSDLFKGQLELHDNGYIKTIPGTTKTNIEGVFAAGDIQDHHYRQAITAAGTGCMAAIEAERFLSSI
ncbi:MAG: thioredoxin-disulfide reductase [Bacteroidales bacterium]|nr:thioredoxin-disulfide reductase [Bacteroidales bacterium]